MDGFIKSVVTARGAAAREIRPTQLAIGSSAVGGDLKDRTALANEIARFDVDSSGKRAGELWAAAHVCAEFGGGFYMREIGLYIADENNPDDRTADILYAVSATDGTGVYIASEGAILWRRVKFRACLGEGVIWLGGVSMEDLETYTPLEIFAGHRHGVGDIDDISEARWGVGDIRTLSHKLPESPAGLYLLCDGREIDLDDYPELKMKFNSAALS